MNFERLWLLFLAVLPVVWMTFHSWRGCRNSLLTNAVRVALLLSALSLPALAMEAAGKTVQVLRDSLNGLSDDDLRSRSFQPSRRLWKGESAAPRLLNPHLWYKGKSPAEGL